MNRKAIRARRAAEVESPYNRLLQRGAEALTDAELLAVLLPNGSSPEAALEYARTFLTRVGGLSQATRVNLATLQDVGLTESRAAAVLAVVEIARRLTRAELRPRRSLSEPGELARHLTVRYRCTEEELIGAIFLDAHGGIIDDMVFFRGKPGQACVEPAGLMKLAVLLDAPQILTFRGHPTNPTPSRDDLCFMQRVLDAGLLLAVRPVDHLIITPSGRWSSMARHRLDQRPSPPVQ